MKKTLKNPFKNREEKDYENALKKKTLMRFLFGILPICLTTFAIIAGEMSSEFQNSAYYDVFITLCPLISIGFCCYQCLLIGKGEYYE